MSEWQEIRNPQRIHVPKKNLGTREIGRFRNGEGGGIILI